jgi:hypothetical protein
MAQHYQQSSIIPNSSSFNHEMDAIVHHTVDNIHHPVDQTQLPFSIQDTITACENSKLRTSIGPDDISSLFIRNGGSQLFHALHMFFHICYQHGLLPSLFTHANIIALYKQQGNMNDPNNYRPISITSVVIRLLERLMLPTLLSFMKQQGIPSPEQFGFTKSRCTLDSIYRLLDDLTTAQSSLLKPIMPTVFIDIVKAYDRVWIKGLLYKLHVNARVSGHLFSFYKALLSNRSFQVRQSTNVSDTLRSVDGEPQGSVSAPPLFIIYIHDLITKVSCPLTKINLFADDIAVWPTPAFAITNSHRPNYIVQQMQQTLNKIDQWASTWKVTLSPSKTKAVIFRKNTTKRPPQLRFSNFEVQFVKGYQYLGLYLDEKLTWIPHLQNVISKCQSTSDKITSLAVGASRAPFAIIRQLVLTVLIPKITYGWALIKLPSPQHKVWTALNKLIITPLRCALGLPHTAHHMSIYLESRILPIPQLHQLLCISFARRHLTIATKRNNFNLASQHVFSHFKFTNQLPENHPLRFIRQSCLYLPTPGAASVKHIMNTPMPKVRQLIFDQFFTTWFIGGETEPHAVHPYYCGDLLTNPPSIKKLPVHLTSQSKLSIPLVMLTSRLRFNRCLLNTVLYKYRKVDSQDCETCPAIKETVIHLIEDCTRYEVARNTCKNELSRLQLDFSAKLVLACFPLSLPRHLTLASLGITSRFLHSIHCIRRVS